MKFKKTYKCPQCGQTFTKILPTNFIKSVMPECPFCGSTKTINTQELDKKTK